MPTLQGVDRTQEDGWNWRWQPGEWTGDTVTSRTPCCDAEIGVAADALEPSGLVTVNCPHDGRRWQFFYVPWVRSDHVGWTS